MSRQQGTVVCLAGEKVEADKAIDTKRLSWLIIYLAGCAVRGDVPEISRLDGVDTDALLRIADKHTLGACVASALESAGLTTKRTRDEVARGIWKAVQLDNDWQAVKRQFDEHGIWYCLLKGAVIKDLYPVFGMRQMCDYDILIDPSRGDEVCSIMQELDFDVRHVGTGNHDVYTKEPVTNFELHRELFRDVCDEYSICFFANIGDRLIADDDGSFGRHMTNEDFYLFMLAHEYKHFTNSGTGLRSPLDIYVYLRKYADELDWDEIAVSLKKLGLTDFERRNRELAFRLFDGETLSEEEDELFSYFSSSGTYGTVGNDVKNKVAEFGGGVSGKLRYVRYLLFPPMARIKSYFPFFYRHKVLLPALFVYRLGKAATTNRAKILTKVRVLLDME